MFEATVPSQPFVADLPFGVSERDLQQQTLSI